MTVASPDVIVIGGGHNGLVAGAYVARAGRRVLVLEARSRVGGTAGSEPFGGATVNLCNCDHLTFRTTPVIQELELAAHGLRYVDVDPGQLQRTWDDDRTWAIFHDLDATLDGLARVHPGAVAGYRRYAKAAIPAARLILEAAAAGPPTWRSLMGVVARRGGRGAATVLGWSRRSAVDVLRHYFDDDALIGPAVAVGPVVWGLSPTLPGTGLGAITYALRHVAQVGRPVGGSGALTDALAAVITHHGGEIRTDCAVTSILCEGAAVRGVGLVSGEQLDAQVVISAVDPRRTLVTWLTNPPASLEPLLARWRHRQHVSGYESKIDAVIDGEIRYRNLGAVSDLLEGTNPAGPTMVVTPTLDELHAGYLGLASGVMMPRPVFLANVPTALDPSMAPPGHHVLSLEALFTPYHLPGGWASSDEPTRWLERYGELVEPGTLERIVAMRAVTPDRYETEFHLPLGHAASFAGGPLAALRSADPELTRYRTPVDGLFLTGAATFPGAGVWGASGRNAALTVLSSQ